MDKTWCKSLEWTTVSGGQKATLTNHQTGAVHWEYTCTCQINVQVILMICTTLTCTVSSSIDSKTRILLLTVVHMTETVSAGADVKHISWWGLVQLSFSIPIFECTFQRKLHSELSTCCALDSHWHFSVLITATRKVKWWSSSVVTRVFPSPALDMSSGRKLVLIAPPSGVFWCCQNRKL